jgi:hypothetical protein
MSNFIGNFGSLAFINNNKLNESAPQQQQTRSGDNSTQPRHPLNLTTTTTNSSSTNETNHFIRNGPLFSLQQPAAPSPAPQPPQPAQRQTWSRPANHHSISYDLFDIAQTPTTNRASFPNRFATLGGGSTNRANQTTPASTNISPPAAATTTTTTPIASNNQMTPRVARSSTFVLEMEDPASTNTPVRTTDLTELYNVQRRARAKTPMTFNFMLNDDSANEIQFDSGSATITGSSNGNNGQNQLVVYGNSVERPRVNYSAKKRGARICVGKQGREGGELVWPVDVALNVFNGQLVVADSGNHRLQVFEADGRFVKCFGVKGTRDGQFDSITGLFADAMANIYVVDRLNHRVQIFDRYCRFVRAIGAGHGSAPGQLNHPWGIAVSLISESKQLS